MLTTQVECKEKIQIEQLAHGNTINQCVVLLVCEAELYVAEKQVDFCDSGVGCMLEDNGVYKG